MWQYHPEIARGYIDDELVADIATVVVTFIVSLIILHLLTMRIADFVVDSKIGPLDRTLGFVFGVLRGVLIAVVIVLFGTWLFPPDRLPSWAAEAKSRPMLENFGNSLIAALPPDLESRVTEILQRGGSDDDQAVPADEGAPTQEQPAPTAETAV